MTASADDLIKEIKRNEVVLRCPDGDQWARVMNWLVMNVGFPDQRHPYTYAVRGIDYLMLVSGVWAWRHPEIGDPPGSRRFWFADDAKQALFILFWHDGN